MKQKDQVNNQLETGKLIIAEPFMKDEFFKKSVIFITDHHPEGTVGFVLNRPLRMNIKRLISDFPKFAAPVHLGGPVQKETIHYIHTEGNILDGSIEIIPGIFWGGDFNQLKFLVSQKVISPFNIRFFVGYSGWGSGQLEREMEEEKSWLVTNGDPNYIFYNENVNLWEQAIGHKGKFLPLLGDMEEEISFN